MADWKDDPGVQAAIERARQLEAVLAQHQAVAAAELAAAGIHPVSVAHGELDSDEAVALICDRLAALAEKLGSRHRRGGNDATTYLFPTERAALEFIAEVTGFAPSWWTVTPTAQPVYNRGWL